jgi:hypothetical protein
LQQGKLLEFYRSNLQLCQVLLVDVSNHIYQYQFSTAIFWGIGLLAHGASIFGRNIIFSKDWEERKISEILDKDKFDH